MLVRFRSSLVVRFCLVALVIVVRPFVRLSTPYAVVDFGHLHTLLDAHAPPLLAPHIMHVAMLIAHSGGRQHILSMLVARDRTRCVRGSAQRDWAIPWRIDELQR